MNMDLHPSSGRSNQEVCGVGGTATPTMCWNRTMPTFRCRYPTMPTFQVLKSLAALHFDVFKRILIFFKLPVSLHWMDDKSEIGTVIRVLYNFRSLQALLYVATNVLIQTYPFLIG